MRAAWSLLVAGVLLAGCSDPPGDEVPESSTTLTSTAPPVLEEVPAEHPLGVTETTPVVQLDPGLWDVTFEGVGAEQFVLRLPDRMDFRGYSIRGQLTILILPIGFELGGCGASDLNMLATGIGGFSATWSNDLAAGDYLVVVVFTDESNGSFSWQVGEGDTQNALDANGEASNWTRTLVEPTVGQDAFEAELPAGFHYLSVRGSTGPLTQSSQVHHAVLERDVACAQGQDESGPAPLGASVTHVLHSQSGQATTWKGSFQHQAFAPTEAPTLTARGVVLRPPS